MRAQSHPPSPRSGLRPGRGPARGLAALVLAGLMLPLAAHPARGHGVAAQTGQGPAAWVRAEYSDGEPMSYAKVRILDPQGATHQVGNADARGAFAWLPEAAGGYRAVLEDGQGHRVEASLDWHPSEPALAKVPAPPTPAPAGQAGQPLGARAAWGLSLVFWLGGAWCWWRGRSRTNGHG